MFRLNKGANTTPSGRLLYWTNIWTLSGDFLACNECQTTQTVRQSETPFTHRPGCSNAKNSANPWEELRDILDSLPLSPARAPD